MKDDNLYPRHLDRNHIPSEEQVLAVLGASAIKYWTHIRKFLADSYDFQPELNYFGKKYGWCYKYRRKGKTLCSLFPETNAFTVLVTLGKNEIVNFMNSFSSFNQATQEVFNQAHQYHDGKWVYKRVLNVSDLNDAQSLLTIKRTPKPINV
jgi:hypothetical protein